MATTPPIKTPKRDGNSKIEKALLTVPHDGQFHRLFDMGFTSAEQTSRGYNSPWSPWIFGYTHETKDGALISVLWVKHV